MFQGSEYDIVILSLVRAANGGDIGFLREAQRVNLAFSRARLGLYVFGDLRVVDRASCVWLIALNKDSVWSYNQPVSNANQGTRTVSHADRFLRMEPKTVENSLKDQGTRSANTTRTQP
ncbi:uncharacterized protein EV422DRAFT_592064, partial [Fimicolochytrium jonesii]|uniref:uncharacterized protein n=1 Tax=Fimicolochytrium jonesii TaxID=1396493 RepID=UPI0022FEA230